MAAISFSWHNGAKMIIMSQFQNFKLKQVLMHKLIYLIYSVLIGI